VIADDDHVRVVRRVEAVVVRVQPVAGHELDLILAADHALAVRMAAERDRLQLLSQQKARVVLEALALGDDHGALGLGLLERDALRAHGSRARCRGGASVGRRRMGYEKSSRRGLGHPGTLVRCVYLHRANASTHHSPTSAIVSSPHAPWRTNSPEAR